VSTAKLPTRSRPDDGRFRGGRLRLVDGSCHPDPPSAPGHLTRREQELFRQAWREPESTLWRHSDAARVARWAYLAARAETDPASWVFTQLNVLERQLVMTPLARAAAGVTLEVDRISVQVQEKDGSSYLVIDTPAGPVTLVDEA
jgi:hypothetical protein